LKKNYTGSCEFDNVRPEKPEVAKSEREKEPPHLSSRVRKGSSQLGTFSVNPHHRTITPSQTGKGSRRENTLYISGFVDGVMFYDNGPGGGVTLPQ